MSNSLRPHGLQHARPPCPSPTLGVDSKLMSVESVMPSNHFILCLPLLLLPSVFPSIRAFSNESVLLIRWPNTGISALVSVFPMNIPGLISFRIDRFDLLAVQGTLKSFLQYQNSKASILWSSAFFRVQLLTSVHNNWKNYHAITIQTLVSKVMYLFLNRLSRFVMQHGL